MTDGPFWSETGLIMQKLSEADRVTLIQHQRKSEDAVRAEALDMGRRMEREAIVAWCEKFLRQMRHTPAVSNDEYGGAVQLASSIRNGEHEKGSGE